jgi:hypothetical protein
MLLLAFFTISGDLSFLALGGNIGLALFLEVLIILGFTPVFYEKFKECSQVPQLRYSHKST